VPSATSCTLHVDTARGIRQTFHAYRSLVAFALVKSRLGLRATVLCVEHKLSRAVKEWSNTARRIRQLCRKTLRVVQKMLNRAQVGAFGQWLATVRKQAMERGAEERKQVLMPKVMKQMQHRGLSAALSQWQGNVHELRAIAGKTSKVMMRWRHQAAASCLSAWHDHALQEKQRKVKSLRAVQKMLNRAQAGTFGRWLATARKQVMERGAEERKQRMMRRVLQKLASKLQSIVFDQWNVNVEQKRANTLKSLRAIAKWANKSCARCITYWRATVEFEWSKRDGMNNMLLRLTHTVIFSAVATWKLNAREHRRIANKVARASFRRANEGAVKCLQVLDKCLQAWGLFALQQVRRRDTMARMLSRRIGNLVLVVLSAWHDHVARERLSAVRVLRGVVKRSRACVSRSLERWWSIVSSERDRTQHLRKMVRRCRRRNLSYAIEEWYACSVCNHRKSMAIIRIMRRWRGQISGRVLEAWHAHAVESFHYRRMICKAVLRLSCRAAGAAMEAWHSRVWEAKRMKAKSRAIMGRIRCGALGCCIDTWRRLACDEKRMRCKMATVVKRMMNQALEGSFVSWRRHAAEAMRLKRKAKMVKRRMLNQAQAGALERWRTNMRELARQRHIMDRILRRMLNAKVAAGETRPLLACLLRVLLIFSYTLSLCIWPALVQV
jgi:hypothetical protein